MRIVPGHADIEYVKISLRKYVGTNMTGMPQNDQGRACRAIQNTQGNLKAPSKEHS